MDEEMNDENAETKGDEEKNELSILLEEPTSPGETASILVKDENGSAVPGLNLSVAFGDENETVLQTDEDGRVEVPIPEDAEKLEIEVAETDENAEFEGGFEHEFEND